MSISLTQVLVALVLVGVAIVLVFAYRRYRAANSKRRMSAMLVSVGLDPDITSSGDLVSIMAAARLRCEACASKDVCERWLDAELQGDNDFCPNATVFESLRKFYADTEEQAH